MPAIKLPQYNPKISRDILNCNDCSLCRNQFNLLLGRGQMPCDLLIIGDYPSQSDDLAGKVLSGNEGRLFDFMLNKSRLSEYRYFITNTLLCRPINEKNGKVHDPTPNELAMCRSNVFKIIEKSKAKFYLLMGDLPKKYLSSALPGYYYIQHPLLISLTGGTRSSMYLQNLRKLEDIYATIQTVLKY